ncbi:hypothetical protein JW968_01700 [Candidatus Woesearchaeota archaeon]|nr:hypothetical protein [Candidatus Woesearchaeota archaeon]
MADRIPTGIQGFDELVQGGFPRGSSILYTGTPGTGKSIFGMQFIYNGALKFKEKGAYVTFEETADEIKEQATMFGWDFDKLEKAGKVKIISIPARQITDTTSTEIINLVKKDGYKRLVIDSLSTLSINAPIYNVMGDVRVKDVVGDNVFFSPPVVGDVLIKKFIYGFIDDLKSMKDVTTICISETPKESEYLSRDTISEFLCDGVIVVSFESLGGAYSRSLLVRKLRRTKNDEDIHPVEISEKGLVVHSIE